MNHLFSCIYKSQIGNLPIIANNVALIALLWENDKEGRVKFNLPIIEKENDVLVETKKQLDDYFSNKRKAFDLPIQFHGTPFQISVWQQLCKIPYGQSISYGQLAKRLNAPNASRAVGAANGRNPISIIVPCHRVIGGSGNLTGFAGGINAKQFLLNLESNTLF